MSILMAALLGLIQGLAEFLPISSSGHLNLLQALFGVDVEHQLLFNILLHVGTLVAVAIVFWKDWIEMIAHPIKKKYTRDQLACLIYIVVSKNVLSMENIDSLFKMQQAHYTSAQAYDTFCDELENYLPYVFGLTKSFSELEPDVDDARKLLRSTIISAVNKIYLDCVFTDLRQEQALWPDILPDLA